MKSRKKPVRRPKKPIRWRHVVLLVTLICLFAGGWCWYVRQPAWAAHEALRLGADDDAEQLLEAAGKRWPQQASWKADVEFLRARLARHRGKIREMHEHLLAARDAGYDLEKLKREQTLAKAQLGEMRGAERDLATLLNDPRGDEQEICNAFIQGYLQIQQFEAARQLLTSWAGDFPEDPRPLFLRGTVQMNIELWKEAEADFRKAPTIDPKHFQSAYHLASVLLTQKHPDRAMEYFRIAAQDKTLKLTALAGQGHCYRLLGKPEKARVLLEKILEDEPNDVTASFELAKLDMDNGDYQKARVRLEPIVAADSRHTDARQQLAVVLRVQGEEAKAQEHFLAVKEINEQLANASDLAERITMDASSADTRLQIAKIYLQYGSRREGLMWLRSNLTIAPEHPASLRELEEYYRVRYREEPGNDRFLELAEEYQRRQNVPLQNTP
ncbi:MAG: tetratricopeptide repeat protein [Pirellulaceae bacterium]